MVLDDVRQSPLSRPVEDDVGARIRLRRTLLGLTQEQSAAALGISYQQIHVRLAPTGSVPDDSSRSAKALASK
jgi:transcriptional regulator with XRE-family HTH domain